MGDEPKPNLLEYHKMQFEFMKHLTTLNTAAILAYATLLEKIIIKKPQPGFSAIVFLGFILSLVLSVSQMASVSKAIGSNTGKSDKYTPRFAEISFLFGIAGVIVAIF